MQLSDYIMALGGLTAGDRLVANALLQPALKNKRDSHKLIDLAADLGMSISDVEASIDHLIAAAVVAFSTPPRAPYEIMVDSIALICVATPAPDLFNQGEKPSETERMRTGNDVLHVDGEDYSATVMATEDGFELRIMRDEDEIPLFAGDFPTREACWKAADEWAGPLDQTAQPNAEPESPQPEEPAPKPPKIPKPPKRKGLVSQSVAAAEAAPHSFPIMLTIGGTPFETTCIVNAEAKDAPKGAGGKPCTKFTYEPAAACPHASFTLYAFSDAVPSDGLPAWAAAFAQRQLDHEAEKTV